MPQIQTSFRILNLIVNFTQKYKDPTAERLKT